MTRLRHHGIHMRMQKLGRQNWKELDPVKPSTPLQDRPTCLPTCQRRLWQTGGGFLSVACGTRRMRSGKAGLCGPLLVIAHPYAEACTFHFYVYPAAVYCRAAYFLIFCSKTNSKRHATPCTTIPPTFRAHRNCKARQLTTRSSQSLQLQGFADSAEQPQRLS